MSTDVTATRIISQNILLKQNLVNDQGAVGQEYYFLFSIQRNRSVPNVLLEGSPINWFEEYPDSQLRYDMNSVNAYAGIVWKLWGMEKFLCSSFGKCRSYLFSKTKNLACNHFETTWKARGSIPRDLTANLL
jgi:hypothetical protein